MSSRALAPRRELLVRLSAALAARDDGGLRRILDEAAGGSRTAEVEEVILQSYLFLGYPVALNAFALWREISGSVPERGIEDDWEGWKERGEGVCRTVYGGQYDGLRRNVRLLHPDMERWMVVEGYGKVLGRPGLDLVTRELCISSLLSVLRAPKQLYSHLRGALNAGALEEEVEAALNLAARHLDREGSSEMWAVWAKVRARAANGGPTPGHPNR
jgi:4-carboxymuconolactone decarboxylase